MLKTIVTTNTDQSSTDAAFRALVAEFQPTFPGRAAVDQALALFPSEPYPDRYVAHGDRADNWQWDGKRWNFSKVWTNVHYERMTHEGASAWLELTPGYVRIRRHDPARAERAHERSVEVHAARVDEAVRAALAGEDVPERRSTVRRVTEWSRKSRSNMVRVLASLDYTPLLADPSLVPAMVTLTYPGDWLAVAPSAAVSARHIDLLRKGFLRKFGYRLDGIWKREFQDRGAPHYHILMTPPKGFQEWLAVEWARIVGAASCGALAASWDRGRVVCCEYHRHLVVHARKHLPGCRSTWVGTGHRDCAGCGVVDFNEGARALDPKRIGIYFAKHGGYAAKEYQNQAPREWLHDAEKLARDPEHVSSCDGCAEEGVGRFWGRWGLDRVVGLAPVADDVADALVRTLRRHSRANSYMVKRAVWRKVTTVDKHTGEVGFKWRKRHTKVRVVRLSRGQRAGYVVVNDAPALVVELRLVAEQVQTGHTLRSGRFLP